MVPVIPVAGSPIVPADMAVLVLLGLVSVLVVGYVYFWWRKRSESIPNRLRKVARLGVLYVAFLLAVVATLVAYWLVPAPKLVFSQVLGGDSLSTVDPIVFVFDRPVSRRKLEKSITPDVPGVWVFEDPLYSTHLMRRVVFYPQTALEPDTEYTVQFSGLTNVSGFSRSFTTTYSFHTQKSAFLEGPKSTESISGTASLVTKLGVPASLQQHALSCEVSALRMALSYRGHQVSEETLLSQVGFDPTPHKGSIWGDPHERFVGNVDGRQMVDGYGVYWEPIARVGNMYRESEAFTSWTTEQLAREILGGNPVIIWVFSNKGRPTSWYTPSGKQIYAVRDEHSVVVVGFTGPPENPTQIIVNDPLIGQIYWSRDWFEKKWGIFNRSGVVIY